MLLRWNSQPDNTLPIDSGRRSIRSGLLAPKPGRQRRTVLKLSYRACWDGVGDIIVDV